MSKCATVGTIARAVWPRVCENVKWFNPGPIPLCHLLRSSRRMPASALHVKPCPSRISLIQAHIWCLTAAGGEQNRKCGGRESKSRERSWKRLGGTLILPPPPGAERGDNLQDNGNTPVSTIWACAWMCVRAAKQRGGGD